MADIEFGESIDGETPFNGIKYSRIMNGLGAIVSVTLIAGLVYWGYQLLVRDVTGVPVVRALEGPMRVAPIDPGGEAVEYQGLAVNNIPAVGEAEAPADRMVLAPKPTALADEDQAAATLEPTAAPEIPELNASTAPVVSSDVANTDTRSEPIADSPTVAEQNEVPAVEQADLIAAALQEAGADGILHSNTIETSVAGVSRSLRPMLRPVREQAELRAPAATPASTASNVSSVPSVDPASIPPKTRLAQLGAYESVAIAEAEWIRIASQFDDFMAGKSRVIEEASSGGKVFYRLRVHGFDDLSDARRFCSALLAGQANCIPVVTR